MVRNDLVVVAFVGVPVRAVFRSEARTNHDILYLWHSQRPVWVIPVNHLLHCFICWNWRALFSVCPKLLVCFQHLHYYMDSNLDIDHDSSVTAL